MKLISMTDFLLELWEDNLMSQIGLLAINYANFLKQPLKLEMFVACDADGNILSKPTSCNKSCSPSDFCEGGKCDVEGCYKEMHKYQQAKEKVLFEGIPLDAVKFHIERERNIEYLSAFGTLELTESAIKQLGL